MKYTQLYEKHSKLNQNRPMETTVWAKKEDIWRPKQPWAQDGRPSYTAPATSPHRIANHLEFSFDFKT